MRVAVEGSTGAPAVPQLLCFPTSSSQRSGEERSPLFKHVQQAGEDESARRRGAWTGRPEARVLARQIAVKTTVRGDGPLRRRAHDQIRDVLGGDGPRPRRAAGYAATGAQPHRAAGDRST